VIRKSIVTLLLILPPMNTALAAVDGATLIAACKEYVAIYDRRGEKRFLAGIATSTAEAMRAGLCRGMLEEHAGHSRFGGGESCSGRWYEQASFVASQNSSDFAGSSERLLDAACND
jgi:hypothetical protein